MCYKRILVQTYISIQMSVKELSQIVFVRNHYKAAGQTKSIINSAF